MDEDISKAEKLFVEGKLNETLEILSAIQKTNPADEASLLLRAKVYYRLQKWGEALNDLNLILAAEPENIAAKNYKTMVLDIISFWNKDSFNP
jgi:regulator of sirC expression with transglutaminase-like and TPR domain